MAVERSLTALEDNLLLFVAIVFVFSLGLMTVEFLWEWRRGKLTGDYFKEIGASLSVQLPSSATEALLAGSVVAIYGTTHQWLPFKIPVQWCPPQLTHLQLLDRVAWFPRCSGVASAAPLEGATPPLAIRT